MTRRLAVIGHPLGHTLSPAIQRAAIGALGLDLTYEAVDVAPEDVGGFLAKLRDPEWLGTNVTVPYKEVVLGSLDHLSDEARSIGAANTIQNRDGKLVGYNTDAPGFYGDATDAFGPLDDRTVAVLGAGGAALGVCFALRSVARRVLVINRHAERAEALVARLGGALETGRTSDLEAADLIVNCTSAGLEPDDSPLANELVPDEATLYDLIYNPPTTRLMRIVRSKGGRAVNGLGMLVGQAALALEIWTGIAPPLDVMARAAEEELASRAHA